MNSIKVYNCWWTCAIGCAAGIILTSYVKTSVGIPIFIMATACIAISLSNGAVYDRHAIICLPSINRMVITICIGLNLFLAYVGLTRTPDPILPFILGKSYPTYIAHWFIALAGVAIINVVLIRITTSKMERAINSQNHHKLIELIANNQADDKINLSVIFSLPPDVLDKLPDSMFGVGTAEKLLDYKGANRSQHQVRNILRRIGKETTTKLDNSYFGTFARFAALDYCNPEFITINALTEIDKNLNCPLLQVIAGVRNMRSDDSSGAWELFYLNYILVDHCTRK